jgi:non-specific protein-tyrosine kinase
MGKAAQQALTDAGKRLAMLADEDSAVAEAFRALRTNLRFNPALGMGSGSGRAVLLADAGGVPERAQAVANLGVAFAKAGERTVLVDAHLRPATTNTVSETTLSALFGQADAAVGLGAAVQGPEGGRKVLLPLVETEIPGLLLLPAGPRVANPADLLGADAFAALVAALRAEAEVVLFDAPPVVAFADARAIAARVDGTLLLVAQDTTRRPQAQAALAALRQVGATVLGVVLTEARE